MSPAPVLIMAGGTGGHVFPALAVAKALREQGASVVWLGTRKGLEARIVPAAGIPIEWVDVGGLRGKGITSWLLAPYRLLAAIIKATQILRRVRPAVVLGMGGFASGPGGIAAKLGGYPLLVHEQNATPGLTNRILAHFARRILQGFPGSFEQQRAEFVGNPVRADIIILPSPVQRLANRQGPARLLVIGGSQGARVLNEIVPASIAALDHKVWPEIYHQTGHAGLTATREAYAGVGIDARCEAFIDDMANAYAWADLVICRAGALTVAELAAVGVAAVLVPYPAAVDDHQTRNALHLVDSGAAVLLPQHELTPVQLADTLATLFADRTKLLEMATKARRLAKPEATQQVAGACLEYAGGAS